MTRRPRTSSLPNINSVTFSILPHYTRLRFWRTIQMGWHGRWQDRPANREKTNCRAWKPRRSHTRGGSEAPRKLPAGRWIPPNEQEGKRLPQLTLRDALFGDADEARRHAVLTMTRSSGRDVRYGAALAFAYAGDDGRALALADDLNKRFPEDTLVQSNFLPVLRAKVALISGKGSEAIEILRVATAHELGVTTASTFGWTGMYPVFVRGEAYLAARQGGEAASEFQKDRKS